VNPGRRPRATAGAVMISSLVITALIVAVPTLRFAYPRSGLHVAIETSSAFAALLAAFLVLGRLRRSGLLCDLVLSSALALFAVANLISALLSTATAEARVSSSATWIVIGDRLVAAGWLAVASVLPAERVGRRSAVGVLVIVGLTAVVPAALVLTVFPPGFLPGDMTPNAAPTTAVLDLPGAVPVVVLQLTGMAFFALAAIGFAERAHRSGDELFAWLAVAAALAAVSRLNYLLYPSLYSRWVFTGDAFGLAAYVVILAGAAQEIRGYWATSAKAAVLEERRRIARDLHDGVAQELAYIARQAGRAGQRGNPGTERIAAAAERALDEQRRALAALTAPLDEPFERALAHSVESIAARSESSVTCDLASGVAVSPVAQRDLLRIAS
jgi:signal transduction histidine kinase